MSTAVAAPWWIRDRERFDREMRALAEAGIAAVQDDLAAAVGVLRLDLAHPPLAPLGPDPVRLIAVFPDHYPFFDEIVAGQLPDFGAVAYTLGAGGLLVGLARRTGGALWPAGLLRASALTAAVAGAAWGAGRVLLDGTTTRLVTLVVVGGIGVLAAAAVVLGHRLLGIGSVLTARTSSPSTRADGDPEPRAGMAT